MKNKLLISLSSLCLALSGCSGAKAPEKSQGELLAESFTSTSYLNMGDILSRDQDGGLSGVNVVSELAGGINAAVLSLISLKPDAFAGWASSTIFKLVFQGEGEDKTQKILDSLSTVEKKIDEINKKLDQVILMLDSVLEKQEINALKSDINVLRSSNAYLQTYIDYAKNLSIGGSSEASLDEETVKVEYASLNQRFKDAPTQVNAYAHLLFDAGAQSGKNIFANLKRIISLNHFLFDYQEVQLKLFNDSAYLVPFLYACAIAYGQLNYVMATSSPSSVEYVDAKAMLNTTMQNAERVQKAFDENKIEMRKQGCISFLYPDSDRFIPFYNKIRNISSETYVNHNADRNRLGDKQYWNDWAFAKTMGEIDGRKTQLYAVNKETTELIADCINALVKNLKMDDMLLSDLFYDAGFDIPYYSGMGEKGIHFLVGEDMGITPSFGNTFYQVTQSISGNKTGNCADKDARKVVNWGIGNVDKTVSMYGWQPEIAVLLTDDASYGVDSPLIVNESGDIL